MYPLLVLSRDMYRRDKFAHRNPKYVLCATGFDPSNRGDPWPRAEGVDLVGDSFSLTKVCFLK